MKNIDYVREAKLLFSAGQLEKSIEFFTIAYENGSDPTDTWLSRGAAEMAAGRYEEAEADFSRVIQKDAKHEKAHYFRGTARVGLGKYDGAIEDFTFSLIRNHDRGIAHLLRGIAYSELGNERDAALDFNTARVFSDAEQKSFKKLFGNMLAPFTHTEALMEKENAPWNNLLSSDAVQMLSNLLTEKAERQRT